MHDTWLGPQLGRRVKEGSSQCWHATKKLKGEAEDSSVPFTCRIPPPLCPLPPPPPLPSTLCSKYLLFIVARCRRRLKRGLHLQPRDARDRHPRRCLLSGSCFRCSARGFRCSSMGADEDSALTGGKLQNPVAPTSEERQLGNSLSLWVSASGSASGSRFGFCRLLLGYEVMRCPFQGFWRQLQ